VDRFAPNNQQLQTRFGLFFFAAGLIVVGLIAIGWALTAQAQQLNALELSTQEMVSLAALRMDGDALAGVTNRADEGSRSHSQVVRALGEIRSAGSSILGVYALRLSESGKVIIAAASSPDYTHHVGDAFPFAEITTDDFLPWTPTWVKYIPGSEQLPGMWGFAPIHDSTGTLTGVLAVRIDTSDINHNILRQVWLLGLIFAIGASLIGGAGWMAGRRLATPLQEMVAAARSIAGGDQSQRLPVLTQDEIGTLAVTINTMLERTQALVSHQQAQIQAAEHDRAQREQYLHAAAAVSQAAARSASQAQAGAHLAELLREGFDLQHVGLFLLDEERWDLSLMASAGKAFQPLADQGLRLAANEGITASCLTSSRAWVASPNEQAGSSTIVPALPPARSEAVAPLRSRGKVFGVVTLHSERPDAFNEQALTALQIACDQAALALENISLAARNQEALQQVSQAYSEISRKAWQDLLRARARMTALCDARGPRVERESGPALAPPESEQSRLSLPIRVRGQVIGVFEAHKAQPGSWSKDDVSLLETLMEQLSIALESARLYSDSQLRAERERMTGEITARMRETLEIETILQTAAREMRRALELSEVEVRMGAPKVEGGNGNATAERLAARPPGEDS
jgi:GAF domain-containing protein/HAMP domain-containing protein